jgi:hypothetical protein
LHGIKKFKLTYYRRDTDQTTNSWDSDSTDSKNLYPDQVILNLEVEGPDHMSFEGIYKFRPEIPLHGLDASI